MAGGRSVAGASSPRASEVGRGSGEPAPFRIDWEALRSLRFPNAFKRLPSVERLLDGSDVEAAAHATQLRYLVSLAASVQEQTEQVALDFYSDLRQRTGESAVCVTGGVGLNSVLNGKIAREAGFEHVYVSPYPGDEGIAVGCAAYGLDQLMAERARATSQACGPVSGAQGRGGGAGA
eukprot:3168685-Pleurochrysis_carterae.AAC.1